jgi:hypothetical protein
MRRELAGKMYSATAYYLGCFFSNLLISLLQPLIMVSILFYNIGTITEFHNFLMLMSFGILTNSAFSGQGYFVGALVPDGDGAKVVNLLFIMIFVASNGILSNLASANWFISLLSSISPVRYCCEGFLRALSGQIPNYRAATTGGPSEAAVIPISQDDVLNKLDYNTGNAKCAAYLALWLVVWIALGCIALNIKTRKL